MSLSRIDCIGCGAAKLRHLDSHSVPTGVTSDCKPWPRAGIFAICEECGHTQKIQNDTWRADVERIYGGYEVYFLSGGAEQVVFDEFTPLPRTRRLLENLRQRVALPSHGHVLDVGCANGSTLRTFQGLWPDWKLAGFDINRHGEAMVRSIPHVTDFYTGTLDEIDRKFDLITMVYVVEHLPNPRIVLDKFRRLLKPGGVIWVHTSDFWANPFDLTVVDHASHFMVDTLAELTERCGFEVLDRNDSWNIKEMGVVARLPAQERNSHADDRKKAIRLRGAPERLRWLGEVVEHARTSTTSGGLGIFGTAIAGTWLASMIPETATFFVDQDQQRVGKTHMERPVLSPREVAASSSVYLAFPTFQAQIVATRLRARFSHVNFIVPPASAATLTTA